MNETTIHVQFVDEQTGQVFAETDTPLSSLPSSFEAATQLEFGGQHWEVVTANPMMAAQFARSGKLILTLRRLQITWVNPQDILYSLPTLCDRIPPVASGTSKLNGHVFELHEDAWRQIELIATTFQPDIQAEIKGIQQIYAESRVGQGFRALHVRKRIDVPLNIPLPEVLSAFPEAQIYDGIAYQRAAGPIEGGFGFETDGFVLFGECQQQTVHILCLAAQPEHNRATFGRKLKVFMSAHSLFLADWCRCAVYEADTLDQLWSRQ
jgi:hypothetical protein